MKMGLMLDSYYCTACQKEEEALCERDDPPRCCGKRMQRSIGTINHFEWGGPRQYRHLREEPFSGRSELRRWARENEIEQNGDKHHGARNEGHMHLGKLYSYRGAPTRSRITGG